MEAIFKLFKENPLNAILAVLVVAVGYLYVDVRALNNKTIEDCKKNLAVEKLQREKEKGEFKKEIDDLEEKLEDVIEKL